MENFSSFIWLSSMLYPILINIITVIIMTTTCEYGLM